MPLSPAPSCHLISMKLSQSPLTTILSSVPCLSVCQSTMFSLNSNEFALPAVAMIKFPVGFSSGMPMNLPLLWPPFSTAVSVLNTSLMFGNLPTLTPTKRAVPHTDQSLSYHVQVKFLKSFLSKSFLCLHFALYSIHSSSVSFQQASAAAAMQ